MSNAISFKYTKDGKKVVVLGQLNSEESIVQEIFVSGDQEIPGGENFVVKGLLDAPAESWKEKSLRKLEQRYDRDREAWGRKISEQNKRLHAEHEKAGLKARALFNFEKNAHESQIQLLIDFLSGAITHCFVDEYKPQIWAIDDDGFYQLSDWDKKIEEMRLVSLFGRSNGNLEFCVHAYSDGSGNRSWRVHPARSYEEALAIAQEICDAEAVPYAAGENVHFYPSRWEKIEGIKILPAALERAAKEREAARQQKIAKLKDELAALGA